MERLWLNEGQPQSSQLAKWIQEQSQGPSNSDVIDITSSEAEEDTDVNQQEKTKEKSTQQKPWKKGKTAKPRNRALQFVPTPDIPAETPVINVPVQEAVPKNSKKKVTLKEPTDREVNRQMKKSENTALKFLQKIKMRLYVDQEKSSPSLEGMELIIDPNKADT